MIPTRPSNKFLFLKQAKIEAISLEINKLTFNGLVTVTVSIVVIGAILDGDGRLELQS